jgi:peroxiredoxin
MSKTIRFFLVFMISTGFAKSQNFSPSDNRIILKTSKSIDSTCTWFAQMNKKDGRFWDNVYPQVKGIPDSLSDVVVYYNYIDNAQALYQAYKSNKIKREDYIDYVKGWGSDTSLCSDNFVNTFIVVLVGKSKKGINYYIPETTNNLDFSDEKAFPFDNGKETFHKVLFERYQNQQRQIDSTWICLNYREPNLNLKFSECCKAELKIGSNNYNLSIKPSQGIWIVYKDPEFNIIQKQTVTNITEETFSLKLHEFVHLGNSFYEIKRISQDGKEVELIKTNDFSKGSTQIGMPPLSFKAKTIKGDSISFPRDFKGKYVLLDFWSTTCPPCVEETRKIYKEAYDIWGGKNFEIIGVAVDSPDRLMHFIEKENIKWIQIPVEMSDSIIKKYRINSFPTLYLINPDGFIIGSGNELRDGTFKMLLRNDNLLKTKR